LAVTVTSEDRSADLPGGLAGLLSDGTRGWRPSVQLPAGHLVTAQTVLRPVADEMGSSWAGLEEFPRPPVCWVTEEPAPGGLWSHLRAAHHRSGLWPLLVFDEVGDAAFGWFGEDESSLALLDPATLLPEWWKGLGHPFLTGAEWRALGLAEQGPPGQDGSGPDWPGLAAPGVSGADPDKLSEELAERMVARQAPAKLALVAATRSADSLALAGWTPSDDESYFAGALSAVVRSWEDRFGARVVAVGRGTLWLSVAAPPTTIEHAVRVTAEHVAFCPEVEPRDDFEFDPERSDFVQYAESIVGQDLWRFWWD
jgi:hypothetical protein